MINYCSNRMATKPEGIKNATFKFLGEGKVYGAKNTPRTKSLKTLYYATQKQYRPSTVGF